MLKSLAQTGKYGLHSVSLDKQSVHMRDESHRVTGSSIPVCQNVNCTNTI